jgi:hypothetical protein
MLLISKLRPARPLLLLIIFLFFGGLDLVGWMLSGSSSPLMATKEWWVERDFLFAYESHATLFLWVPQHALPGLIGILLLLRTHGREPPTASLGLVGAAVLLWSPFVALGLLPFALAGARGSFREIVLDPGNILCSILLVIPLLTYLLAGTDSIPHGFNWERASFSIGIYATFVLLEAGVFILALIFCGWTHLRYPAIVIVSLLGLPLYRIGLFNDFTMRASIPAIALLAIAVAVTLSETRSLRVLPLAVLVVIGSAGAVLEMVIAGRAPRVAPAGQSMRAGFLRDDPRFFVQYNAPLPNWVLR